MKSIRYIILTLFASLSVQAQCYLSKVYNADNSLKDQFTYDTANKLIWLEARGWKGSLKVTNFEYGNNLVTISSSDLGKIEIKKSSDGKLLSATSSNGIYYFIYQEDRLQNIQFSRPGFSRTLRFEYSGNNINKVIFVWNDIETVVWEGILFDDSHSRFPKELKDYDLIALSEVFLFRQSDFKLDYYNPNNVMISRTLNRQNGLMKEIRYRYKYNDQGYPTQVRYTVDDDSFVAEYRFEYICN